MTPISDKPTLTQRGRLVSSRGVVADQDWQIAAEVPVALMLNSQAHAVMMASPADLEDFGVGFVLSEGLAELDGIRNVLAFPGEDGFTVDVALAGQVLPRKRAMEGRSGCGLCGVEEIAQVLRPMGKVKRGFALNPLAVLAAFADLPERQPMNRSNHSVHGAAWVSPDGEVIMVREDVGRHNALDKLIGALARQKVDLAGGFVAMTSRLSFELVQKAATIGIAYVASLSAPTSLALSLARETGVGLASRAQDGVWIFDEESDDHGT